MWWWNIWIGSLQRASLLLALVATVNLIISHTHYDMQTNQSGDAKSHQSNRSGRCCSAETTRGEVMVKYSSSCNPHTPDCGSPDDSCIPEDSWYWPQFLTGMSQFSGEMCEEGGWQGHSELQAHLFYWWISCVISIATGRRTNTDKSFEKIQDFIARCKYQLCSYR